MNGYFDLQVNGYAGIDFNQDNLSADAAHTACERLRADGVTGILATIITDHIPVMAGRLRRLVELRESDPLVHQLIVGVHVEGPFLNETEGYRGAHPADAIQPANRDIMQRLVEAGDGLIRLVTLAPERDSGFMVTRYLAGQGIVVAAGHCDPTLEELRAAADAGLTMFTHLGNGCPRQMPRHDNILQRVLSLADRLWLCFIADGVHVPFFALRNYLKAAGIEHCVIVTDAMAAAGLGPGRYRLSRWEVVVGDDMAAWAPDHSHLVGAAITMPQSAFNLAHRLNLAEAAVCALTCENPRRALGCL